MDFQGEIDLHGLSVEEGMAEFLAFYNARVEKGSREPFKVIHGYGASGHGGEIRKRLRKYLQRYPDCVDFKRGERTTGNPGETFIIPVRVLPTKEEGLVSEILEFCAQGKSESKIFGKFRRHDLKTVKHILKDLERQGRIRTYSKGKYKYYQTEW